MIRYSVETSGGEKRSPLGLKLAGMSYPFDRTVYFDGRRSCVRELATDHGFRVLHSVLRDTAREGGKVAVRLPRISCWYVLPQTVDASPAVSGPAETILTGEEKQVLGYRCKKAVVDEHFAVLTYWYVPELHFPDPTGAILQDSRIPGLVLELTKTFANGSVGLHYKAIALDSDTKTDAAVFVPPPGAVEVPDFEDAVRRDRELFEREMEKEPQLSSEQKDAFLGKWTFSFKGDRIVLLIERYGEAYTLTETQVINGKRRKTTDDVVQFRGSHLLVKAGAFYKTYVLAPGGTLRCEQDDFFVFRKNPAKLP